MQIQDPLYGEFELEDVLVELLQTKPLLRLKGIHQGGACYLVNKSWHITRYEHSIGVMLLIKRLGGTLEEQIAGLLHDLSHTAFSHVVDHVFDNQAEDYHEQIFEQVVRQSEIPNLLARYGFRFEELLLDDSRWTRLEQAAPELCADRIDYTLRDQYHYYQLPKSEIDAFLDQLVVVEGKIFLKSLEAAEWFTEVYYREVIDFFLNPQNIYSYQLLAKTLKRALELKLINEADFLLEDEELMTILRGSDDATIRELLGRLHERVVVEEDEQTYDIHQKNKIRLIDPSILQNGKLVSASTLSPKVKHLGEQALAKATKGAFVKIISA